MPTDSPSYPQNLDISVGYSYDGNWMSRMTKEQFYSAKEKIKARADEIDPRRKVRLMELKRAEYELLSGDELPPPREWDPALYSALEDVMNHAEDAARLAVQELNAVNGQSFYPAPVTRCPGCVINLKTGLHSNTLRLELRDSNGPVGVDVSHEMESAQMAHAWVPLEVVLRWDCH